MKELQGKVSWAIGARADSMNRCVAESHCLSILTNERSLKAAYVLAAIVANLLFSASAGRAQTPPANDFFNAALPLSGTNLTIYCDNSLASLEPGESPPSATSAGKTLWYSWAAPFTGRVSIRRGPDITTFPEIAVYSGATFGGLQRLAYGRDGCLFMGIEGRVFYLQVDGADGRAGQPNFSLQATPFLPPENDHFTNAIVFGGSGGLLGSTQSVSSATLEPGEPAHLGGQACKSLWWRWQAPINANAIYGEQTSLASNITVAVYSGTAVEALSLVSKAAHWVSFQAVGGTTYYIAAVVPSDAVGDVALEGNGNAFTRSSIPVPGNLLQEWSFENTDFNFHFWHLNGPFGGSANQDGGADGTTWPQLYNGTELWQEFVTVTNRIYEVKFAFVGAAHVKWDDREIANVQVPAGEMGFWHWTNLTVTASNSTSRLTFVSNGNVYLDAVSVVWMHEPPSIITQPASLSTVTGGTASYIVGARGLPPLSYQWYFQSSPLPGATNNTLVIEKASDSDAGQYYLAITNAFGSVTSSTVALVLDAPINPTIVLQPYNDTVAVGGYFALSVAAIGTAPLYFQWYLNGTSLTGATNRQLVFAAFDPTNAGTYTVKVENTGEAVWSFPATLAVAESNSGGGLVLLANWFLDGYFTNQAPIFDVDTITKLSGSDYVAELYAGPTLALLRPAGAPTPFNSGINAGFFQSKTVILPTVAPGTNAFVQVRVWQASKGASYEEARALGSKFGRSDVLQLVAGGNGIPQVLSGLKSFTLQAGLPQFTAGRIVLAGQQPDGTPVWSLLGEAGYRYSIERTLGDFVWQPWLVLTNVTGTATFVDPSHPPEAAVFYRARILE